jgi:hypothetical protein
MGGKLKREKSLNARDWAKVDWFLKYVQRPFLHSLVQNARDRAQLEKELSQDLGSKVLIQEAESIIDEEE